MKKRKTKKRRINKVKEYRRWMRKMVKTFNAYIRKRDKVCQLCGTDQKLTAGHLITAKKIGTRFHELNVFGQCSPCNSRHRYDWHIYLFWFLGKYGQANFDNLYMLSTNKTKPTLEELKEGVTKYKQLTLELE